MTKAGDKLIEAAKEAVAFARGDCDHDWTIEQTVNHGPNHEIRMTRTCSKCRVRVTEFADRF